MKTVTVFCTRNSCEGDPDYENARRLGRMLAEAGFGEHRVAVVGL